MDLFEAAGVKETRPEKILAIDAMAFLYRAYHSHPGLTAPDGRPTGALHGFMNAVVGLLISEQPTHLFVAFEGGTKTTVRHEQMPTYKAQRKPTPDDLYSQIALCHELVTSAGFGVVSEPGYEADDLLASLAGCATNERMLLIASGDRDLFQLLSSCVNILQPGRAGSGFTRYDVSAFREKYALEPAQWVERRALEGDASDNLPGVAGVGEKAAMMLVQKYGTLENIYEHLDELAPGLRKRLELGKESAFLTRKLSRLLPDCQVVDVEQGRLTGSDDTRFTELLADLGLRSLAVKWAKWRLILNTMGA